MQQFGWGGGWGGLLRVKEQQTTTNELSTLMYRILSIVLPFHRYFTLFMNLLNDCSEEATEEKCTPDVARKRTSSNLSALRNCTVLAMSNLLNANIDSGLMHSIGEKKQLLFYVAI